MYFEENEMTCWASTFDSGPEWNSDTVKALSPMPSLLQRDLCRAYPMIFRHRPAPRGTGLGCDGQGDHRRSRGIISMEDYY